MPLGAYALTRLVTFLVVSLQQRDQIALPFPNSYIRIFFPQAQAPGYFSAMTNWDGQWYELIATGGYPSTLPRAWDGSVDMNQWAYFPIFPLSSRVWMDLTHLPFDVVGPLWATLVGAVAIVLLFRFVDETVGRWAAVVTTVAMCTYVAAPIFQAAYTESFALLFVVLSLKLLRARRYGWLALSLLALALTRNVVLVFAPVLIVHGIVAYRARFRTPFPRPQQVAVAVLAVYAAALTWLWPTVAGIVTGVPNAYNQTMAAWRIDALEIKLGIWWDFLYTNYGLVGQVLGVVGALAFAGFMVSRPALRWGPEIWAWAGAYPAYLILVTTSGPSRMRYALLAWPFALIIAWFIDLPWWRRWRWWLLGAIAVAGLLQQAWYTDNVLLITHLDGVVYYP